MISRRSLLAGSGSLVLAPAVASFANAQTSLRTYATSPELIKIHWKTRSGDNYSTLDRVYADLTEQNLRPEALMNAGIYEVGPSGSYQPQGLHIENNRQLRPLNTRSARNANFYLKPNGVFYIDQSGAYIVRTEDYAPALPVRLAVQSGPLLFDEKGIHPKFFQGSNSRKRRNAIGLQNDGRVLFAISDVPINFWDFSQTLKHHYDCKSALYLDGTISALWLANNGSPPNNWQAFAAILSANAPNLYYT